MAHTPGILTLKFCNLALGLALTLGAVAAPSNAAVLLNEGFESPAIAVEGGTSASLPAGWLSNSGTPSLWRPGSLADDPGPLQRWTQSEPMAAPAGGNQVMFLHKLSGAYFNVGAIQPQTVYELSAAIGVDVAIIDPYSWSLQFYADSNDSAQLDLGDEFISQQYGGSGTETTPPLGGWALNSTSFDSAVASPTILGKSLFAVLFNFNSSELSTSSYDNVTVTAVPEPSSWLLAAIAVAGVGVARGRARRQF